MFKVGDKVKICGNSFLCCHTYDEGEIVRIIKVYKPHYCGITSQCYECDNGEYRQTVLEQNLIEIGE